MGKMIKLLKLLLGCKEDELKLEIDKLTKEINLSKDKLKSIDGDIKVKENEFEKYETELLIKSGQKKEEFTKIFNMLKSIIKIVPEKEYFQFMKEAEKISPDFKDIHYFALALKLKCPIWSNDKRLKEQNQVKIVSTTELLKEVNYE